MFFKTTFVLLLIFSDNMTALSGCSGSILPPTTSWTLQTSRSSLHTLTHTVNVGVHTAPILLQQQKLENYEEAKVNNSRMKRFVRFAC